MKHINSPQNFLDFLKVHNELETYRPLFSCHSHLKKCGQNQPPTIKVNLSRKTLIVRKYSNQRYIGEMSTNFHSDTSLLKVYWLISIQYKNDWLTHKKNKSSILILMLLKSWHLILLSFLNQTVIHKNHFSVDSPQTVAWLSWGSFPSLLWWCLCSCPPWCSSIDQKYHI